MTYFGPISHTLPLGRKFSYNVLRGEISGFPKRLVFTDEIQLNGRLSWEISFKARVHFYDDLNLKCYTDTIECYNCPETLRYNWKEEMGRRDFN